MLRVEVGRPATTASCRINSLTKGFMDGVEFSQSMLDPSIDLETWTGL
ncbi:MAG: hypothetical protein ACI8T1_003668 [Verrucomicrobiales bacterium]|jgi:hypothetical protein